MTGIEAIEARTSRRSYQGSLSEDETRRLRQVIAAANLEYGLSFALLEDGAAAFAGVGSSYGLFSGVRSLVAAAGPQQDPDLPEKIGRAGEELVLEATKMGLGTCWVGGTFNKKALNVPLPAGHSLLLVITVGPVKEGKGLVERAAGSFLKRRAKKAEQLYTADDTPPEWFLQGVAAVAGAPSAMNRQPVRFAFKDGVATAAVQDAAGYDLVDLGIAKVHFEIGAGGRFALGNGAAFTKA